MSYFTKHETLTLKNVLDGEGNVPLRFKRDAEITGKKFAEKYTSFKNSTNWLQFKESGGTFADAKKCIKNGNLQIDFTGWEDCQRMIFEAATRFKEAEIRNAMQKVFALLTTSQRKALEKEVEHIMTLNNNMLDDYTFKDAVTEYLAGDERKAFIVSKYGKMSDWNVSQVTDMSHLFEDEHLFNEPLNNWDVSNVTDMRAMFYGATSFNQSLDKWDVVNVTNMDQMFMEATSFNQPLTNWAVANVEMYDGMFKNATSFESKNIPLIPRYLVRQNRFW